MSVAMLPSDTEILPELENWPHSRFSKSRSFTRFQVESVAAIGASGITMDLFDLFGNGAMPTEGYEQDLVEAKKLAGRLMDLKLDRRQETGIQVLFDRRASATVQTSNGRSFSELEPDEGFWASFLAVMGVAHTFREWHDRRPGVAAVSGQFFRSRTEAEIRQLFSDSLVLLNGDAVSTLVEMGLGNLLDIRGVEWHASDSGIPSFEQVVDGKVYAGLRLGRLTAQALTGDYLHVDYGKEARLLSEVYNPSSVVSGPGMAVVGRRALILPFGRGAGYLGLRHPVRQAVLQAFLAETAGVKCPVLLEETANVAVFTYESAGRFVVLLVNGSLDDLPEVRLRLPEVRQGKWKTISRTGIHDAGQELTVEGSSLVLTTGMARLGVLALVRDNA